MINLHCPETFSVILGLSTIMSVFFYSVKALQPGGDWRPFEYLATLPDSRFFDPSDEIFPNIKVQAVLSEGLGWEGQHDMSMSNAFHVIVSIVGTGDQGSVPIPGHVIRIKSPQVMPCVIEQGNARFDDCVFGPNIGREFVTNMLGRVSFSVPLDGIESLEHSLPPLLIQSAQMPENQW
jgi:hypothetical protein